MSLAEARAPGAGDGPGRGVAVCIAGMHRSGTSMVARLLALTGLYLGPEDELLPPSPHNEEGYWENVRFVRLNDEVLTWLGGAWDLVPAVAEGWESGPGLGPARAEASRLVETFAGRPGWGWKDPRNTLTLAFWRQLVPGLRIVLCVRDPIEVAESLHRRSGSTLAFGLRLWLDYNRRLLETVPAAERVVTHYDAYFHDARAELSRVLDRLGLAADEGAVERACATVAPGLRHNRATAYRLREVAPRAAVVRCYLDLVAEAGPVAGRALEAAGPGGEEAALAGRVVAALAPAEAAGPDPAWAAGVQASRLHELGRRVADLEHEVRELRRVLAERDREVARLGQALAEAGPRLVALERELAEIGGSTAWALARRVVRLRLWLAPPGTRRDRALRKAGRALRPR